MKERVVSEVRALKMRNPPRLRSSSSPTWVVARDAPHLTPFTLPA